MPTRSARHCKVSDETGEWGGFTVEERLYYFGKIDSLGTIAPFIVGNSRFFFIVERLMTIYFFKETDPIYGCFSNFSSYGFDLDGAWWPTSEHYFQAQKFAGTHHVEAIRQAPTPTEATQMGRDRNRPLRSDWEEVKDSIMHRATLAKFKAHEDIRQILLDTGDEQIVEQAPHEEYWGSGKDGNGLNRMGEILMAVRKELRHS